MDIIQIFTTVLAIAGITGGAAGWFAKSRGDTIIALQGKEIDYWKTKAEEFEKENTKVTAERNSLQAENKKLWDRAQGSQQLTALTKEIRDLVSYVKNNGNANIKSEP